MQLVLKKAVDMFDASNAAKSAAFPTVTVPAGTHEVERILNPLGDGGGWLVLVGTQTGLSEHYLRQRDVPGRPSPDDDIIVVD